MNMADKTALRDMLNHMINGNEEAAVAAFKEYLPLKTREIMGPHSLSTPLFHVFLMEDIL